MQTIKRSIHPTRNRPILRLDFESLGAFARECKEAGVSSKYSHGGSASWWGGDSLSTLEAKCVSGETTHVAAAEALLEQLRDEIEVPRPQWAPSPFGAFPNVGEFLAGEIDCMRLMANDPSQTAPVRVWYDPTSSAAISHEDLVKRGTAALALAMALSQIRPVELWTFSDLDAKRDGLALICAKIQTAPLMLSEACFALCNPGYARGLTYGLAERRMDFQGMWGFGDYCQDATERAELMRAALGAAKEDIIIPGISARDELVKDPLAFIRREIKRHTLALEEA